MNRAITLVYDHNVVLLGCASSAGCYLAYELNDAADGDGLLVLLANKTYRHLFNN